MPNWCENTLYINTEEKEDMKELKDLLDETIKCSKSHGLLGAIIPMPKELEKTESPSDTPNWRDWCNSNWGTKWDVILDNWEIEDDYMRLEFLSAWGPPVKWLEKVASIFPKLRFCLKYDEPGGGFMGCAKGQGNIIDEYIEY